MKGASGGTGGKKVRRWHESLKQIQETRSREDAHKFIEALHTRDFRLLQRLPPAACGFSGVLDTILYRGTLLVLYASRRSVIVALGADFSVVRQIFLPRELIQKLDPNAPVKAVVFRPADAAIAVAVSGYVIIYRGWFDGQDPQLLWSSDSYESILEFGTEDSGEVIGSLSFSQDSRRLAAIGAGVRIYETAAVFAQNGCASEPAKYKLIHSFKPEESCGDTPYTIGAISPMGNMVAAATEGAEEGLVWHIGYQRQEPKTKDVFRTPGRTLSMPTEKKKDKDRKGALDRLGLLEDSKANVMKVSLSFGRSGISSMSWKLRGGGRAALLVVDIDGQMHMFAKGPRSTNEMCWVEEVARTPHMEGVGKCAGAFVNWGGGGGAASDENDAIGTGAGQVLIDMAAPRPSRCYHWVALCVGAEVKAWRAGGLDDRPKAAFARLEPGESGGVADVNVTREDQKANQRLHISAVRAMAPVPLTCITEENSRLVKAYAISNNERRIRSPEPPEPPQIMATFNLSVLNGQTFLSRWDQCPTSSSPAVCNALSGIGHRSAIRQIEVACVTDSGFSVASLGRQGDALLWACNVGSPFAPLQLAGQLKGPHTALCVPSSKVGRQVARTLDKDEVENSVLGVDAQTGSLNLYALSERPLSASRRKSFVTYPYAKLVGRSEPGHLRTVSQLLVAPARDEDVEEIILGIDDDRKQFTAWRLDLIDDVVIQSCPCRVEGELPLPVTSCAMATTVEGRSQLICGSQDGCIRLFNIRSEGEDFEEVEVVLEYVCTLTCGKSNGTHSPVTEVTASAAASRIAVLQGNGDVSIFVLSGDREVCWRREVLITGTGQREHQNTGCIAFGRDARNSISLVVGVASSEGGGLRLYKKDTGLAWEEAFDFGMETMEAGPLQPKSFVMPGVLLAAAGPTMLVYSTSLQTLENKRAMTIFNPKNIISMMWSGMTAVEVVNITNKLGQELDAQGFSVVKDETSTLPTFTSVPVDLDHFLGASVETAPRLCTDKLGLLENLLRSGLKLRLLRTDHHSRLLAFVASCRKLEGVLQSLDKLGASFALQATTFLIDPTPSGFGDMPAAAVSSALHSTSVDALLDLFLHSPVGNSGSSDVSWDYCRSIGVGWWVRSYHQVKNLAERIARLEYIKSKDPNDCAMWYIFMNKAKALAALYRQKGDNRMFEFFKRDFKKEENRRAAAKNAYVLISKHKLHLAAGLFYLAGDYESATSIIRVRLGDSQLSIILARLIDGDGPPEVVHSVLNLVAERSASDGKSHEEAMALWLLDRPKESVHAAGKAAEPDASVLNGSCRSEGSDPNSLVSYERAQLVNVLGALNHVLAIAERPSMRSEPWVAQEIVHCRRRAAAVLAAEGSPVLAMRIIIQLVMGNSDLVQGEIWLKQLIKHIITVTLTWRAVKYASLAKDPEYLASSVRTDCIRISDTCVGIGIVRQSVLTAAQDLSLSGEVDACIALAVAGQEINKKLPPEVDASPVRTRTAMAIRRLPSMVAIRQRAKPTVIFEEVLRKVIVHSLYITSGMFSHVMTFAKGEGEKGGVRILDSRRVRKVAEKLRIAIGILEETSGQAQKSFILFAGDMVRVMQLLQLFAAFLDGDWIEMRRVVHATTKDLFQVADRSYGSSDAKDDAANFAEELRQVADNPLLQPRSVGKKEEAGRTRRMRVSQHFSTQDHKEMVRKVQLDEARKIEAFNAVNSKLMQSEEALDPQKITSSSKSTKLIKEQGLLSSTLSAVVFAALTSCVAQMASGWSKKKGTSGGSQADILNAAEAIDALAMDAVYGWYPLLNFGRDAASKDLSDEQVSYFAALWKSMASIPDFAPYLREAATVAAAFDTSTAEHYHRSTRDSEYLHNPFPVRFSAATTGPWSGRGKYSVLFREDGALIRSLCVAASDPPLIALCTPKGIQKVIPSSYAPPKPTRDDIMISPSSKSPAINKSHSWSFFESEYEPFVLTDEDKPRNKAAPGSVTLSETEATALASHPRRRRFASGGVDGLVRLWNFDEKISQAGLRDKNHGRVVSLQFSAYGDGLLCTYANGYAAIWHDPDVYHLHAAGIQEGDAILINGFGNRRASEAIFLDERNTIAAVGDPSGAQGGASASMGHSLRVFDVRESSHTVRATWTARVHSGGEARCLALLEDRMRLVTGGSDGSMSVVDVRTRTCIAELPAHGDEVICLRTESPRGRALASGCRNGDIKIWDSRTLRVLDPILKAHTPTRQWLTGSGFGGLVGVHGVRDLYLTDRALISCGGDGLVKVWGPGWGDFDHQVL